MSVDPRSAPNSHRIDVLAGARDGVPAALGTAPYGLVMGIVASSAGLTVPQAVGMSAFVFAGLSQLAMADLLDQGAAIVVVVITALIINIRFAMYSASIAPYLERLGTAWRWSCPFFLVGPVYAVVLGAFEQDRPAHYGWYFLGVAVPSWVTWVVGTLVGMTVGAQIPGEWQLGFAVPLLFIAIVTRFVEDRATVLAALGGGGVAVLFAGMPLNLGLLVGSVVGVVAGRLSEASRA